VLVCGLKFGHVFALLFCAPRLATAAATGDSEAEIREAAAVANLLAEIASAPFRWGFLLRRAVPELVDPLPAVARSIRLTTSISGVAMGFVMLVLKHSAQELAEQGDA